MMPRVELQSALVAPDALRIEINLTWVRRADHSICQIRVLDRPGGQQLALSVGSVEDMRHPKELREQLQDLVAQLVHATFDQYVEQDPF